MIKTNGNITTITCDKCGDWSNAHKDYYNTAFFSEGWVLNRGRKYTHLCNKCLTPKQRKALIFVAGLSLK